MSLETKQFEFGEFVLDAREKVLLRQGKSLPITPKVFELLLVLIENHGHLVEKSFLMEKVWPDSFVEESNLTFSIRQLRKILGDDIQHPRFIETVPKRGYRFIASTKSGTVNGFDENGSLTPLVKETRPEGWRSRPILFSIAAVLLGVALMSAGFFIWQNGNANAEVSSFEDDKVLEFENVTSSDRPMTAAISPDGKYIAYSRMANGLQSLWLKHLSSGVNAQIVEPEDGVIYLGIEFSPDNDYIYFMRRTKDGPTHLDCVSILGGTPKTNILTDIDGAFSISPDNRLISFRRYEPQKRYLLVSDIDGNNERRISETTKTFTDNVFSPDGKTIAFASGQSDTGERDFGVYLIDVESSDVKPATEFRWVHVRSIAWLPDQSSLLITAALKGAGPSQLWRISLQDGGVEKIVNSEASYSTISASADMSKILLTQVARTSNLYMAQSFTPDNIRPLAEASDGLAWMRDGSLVYSPPSGNRDLWQLSPDKKNQKQLTVEDSIDFDPTVSPDGRYIVFVSDRAGKYNLWRINTDGSQAVALTNGQGEQKPAFTADGAFVVYSSMKDVSLWKVPIEGGEPKQVSHKRAYNISVSPDGSKFAHFAKVGDKLKMLIKSLENGESLHEFDTPAGYFTGSEIVWSRNGDFLFFVAEDDNSVGNIWRQSIESSSPEMLTHYTSEEIFSFDFSPDGTELALIRGTWNHDAVLLKGFRP